MKRSCVGVLVCALFASAPVVAQTVPVAGGRIAILPVSGTNVHPGYLEAAQELLKDHLMATGRFTVIILPGPPGTTESTGQDAVARGREAGTDLAVVVHLTRLAGTGRVRMLVYQIGSGSMVYSDSIAIAGGPDDLDPALKRLAVGLATGKSVSQTADIETVTQKESDAYMKETATKSFGLRIGALLPFNRPSGDGAVAGVGVFWLYDARKFLGEINVDLHAGNGGAFAVGIGGYYPFNKGNFTPYLGTQVAYAFFSQFGGVQTSGVRVQPTIGVLLGRLSTVQFRAEVGYFANTFGERTLTYNSGISSGQPIGGEKHYAHGPSLAIGLGF